MSVSTMIGDTVVIALSARDWDISQRYQDGETLQAIGLLHGITRERVRQIAVNKCGHTARMPLLIVAAGIKREAKREITLARFKARADLVALAKKDVEKGMSQRKACVKHGLPINELLGTPSQHGRWRPEMVARQTMIKAYLKTNSGGPLTQVAKTLGVPYHAVLAAKNSNGMG